MSKKALLMILDGWGIGNHSQVARMWVCPMVRWEIPK